MVRTGLRSLRNTLGLSLDELAARTNLSPSTISRVETGKRTISLDILPPLATALQVDLDALLEVRGRTLARLSYRQLLVFKLVARRFCPEVPKGGYQYDLRRTLAKASS